MKKFNIKRLLPMLIAAVLLTRCSCDFFGTTGALFVSEADEMKLGLEFDTQLRNSESNKAEYPIYMPKTKADTGFKNYVIGLAQEVVDSLPKSQRPGYPFTFTLIDKDVENAFAVPGGYVYIYTGIIKKMQDESELVGVIGHEIAHVTQHHYRDALAKNAAFSILLQGLFGNDSSYFSQLITGSFSSLVGLRVSVSNESEADEFGTKSVARLNRNPLGIAKFFSRFESGGPLSWLGTHPDPPDRVEDVSKQVNANPRYKALAEDSLKTNYKTQFETYTSVLHR
jgi:beta-barrel assembly-enhancing protease